MRRQDLGVGWGGCTGALWDRTPQRRYVKSARVLGGGGGGRVSAYPDWTAQVEETPGSSLIRPREVLVHP